MRIFDQGILSNFKDNKNLLQPTRVKLKSKNLSNSNKHKIQKSPSIVEIRKKLQAKFGKPDVDGKYHKNKHLKNNKNKALRLAKKSTQNLSALRNALSNNTVNFSQKERDVLNSILNKSK